MKGLLGQHRNIIACYSRQTVCSGLALQEGRFEGPSFLRRAKYDGLHSFHTAIVAKTEDHLNRMLRGRRCSSLNQLIILLHFISFCLCCLYIDSRSFCCRPEITPFRRRPLRPHSMSGAGRRSHRILIANVIRSFCSHPRLI